MTVSTVPYSFHVVFLCSPQHYDIWLSRVTHPLCCKAAIDYSSLCVITSFHPQWAVHIFFCIFFPCVSLPRSFWMLTLSCSIAIPPSLQLPEHLVSEHFPVGAEKGVRLSKAQDHEGTRERFSSCASCSVSLVSSMSWGRAALAPPQMSAFPGPSLCALLSSASLSPAPAGQAFKVLGQPEVIF